MNPMHPSGPAHPGSTADRLTAALHARTATLGEDTLTTRAPAYPTAPSGPSGYPPREPLLPRWGWAVAVLAVVASIVAGAVLGVRGGDPAPTPVAQLMPKTRDLGQGVTAQAALKSVVQRGDTIRVELDLKNLASRETTTSWYISDDLGRDSTSDLSGVQLSLNGLRVQTAEDSDGKCICTRNPGSLSPQESLTVDATFDMGKTVPKVVDVTVPTFGTWLDVPVTRT